MAFTTISVSLSYPGELSGTIDFTLSANMVNGGTTIKAQTYTAILGPSSSMFQRLPANNDPGTSPSDTNYLVHERLGSGAEHWYTVVVPYDAAGGTCTLASLTPTTYVPPINFTPLTIPVVAASPSVFTHDGDICYYPTGLKLCIAYSGAWHTFVLTET